MMERYTHKESQWQTRAWYEEARRIPTVAPTQGLDGAAGFYYYDRDRALAFHWDGDATQSIEVAHGGDHEPVLWRFSFILFKPGWVIAGTKTAAMAFQYACENWIDAKEDAR